MALPMALRVCLACLVVGRVAGKHDGVPNGGYAEVTWIIREALGLPTPATSCIARWGLFNTTWDEKQASSGRISAEGFAPDFRLGYRIYGSKNTDVMVEIWQGSNYIGLAYTPRPLDLRSVPFDGYNQSLPILCTPAACPGSRLMVSFYPGNQLAYREIPESFNFEGVNPIAPMRAVKVDDITGDGPLVVGKHPMPPQLQGLFWLTHQKSSSALVAFGGPNNDAGGMNTGFILGPEHQYRIRVMGAQSFSSAQQTVGDVVLEPLDAVYRFQFNNGTNPTFADIYSENADGFVYMGPNMKWIMDLTMTLMPDGMPEYPGSVTWLRVSKLFGFNMGENYNLVQVMHANGTRIPAAWDAFKAYMMSAEAGPSPGWIWYPSRYPSPSVGAAEKETENAAYIRTQIIVGSIAAVIGACCICCCCGACCFYLCKPKKGGSRDDEDGALLDDDDAQDYGDYDYDDGDYDIDS